MVCESEAILVYLCLKAGRADLLGRTPEEKVDLTAARGNFQDIFRDMTGPLFGDWEGEKAKVEELLTGKLKNLDAFLGKKEFIAGGLTYVDFVLMDGCNIISLMFDGRPLKANPGIQAWYERVNNLPTVKAYKSSPRYRERPVMPPMAKWN